MSTARSARAILIAICLLGLVGSVAYVGWYRHLRADLQLTLLLSDEMQWSYIGVQEMTTFDEGREQNRRVRIHRKAGKERLEYLTGPAQGMVLIDDGNRLWRLDSHRRIAAEFASERRSGQSTFSWRKNYRARAHSGAKVAGRRCKGLRIEPDDHIGPTRILWYEPPAGAGRILKREDYNTSGRLASRSEFAEIDYDQKVGESVFEVPSDYEVLKAPPEPEPVMLDDAEETVGFAPLIPSYVPDGYELDRSVLITTRRGRKLLQIEYFDGLNRIAVVEHTRGRGGADAPGPGPGMGFGPGQGMGRGPNGEPPHRPRPGSGSGAGGPTGDGLGPGPGPGPGGPKGRGPGWLKNRMVGAVVTEVGEVRVSVIGDLPPEELQKIADSIQ